MCEPWLANQTSGRRVVISTHAYVWHTWAIRKLIWGIFICIWEIWKWVWEICKLYKKYANNTRNIANNIRHMDELVWGAAGGRAGWSWGLRAGGHCVSTRAALLLAGGRALLGPFPEKMYLSFWRCHFFETNFRPRPSLQPCVLISDEPRLTVLLWSTFSSSILKTMNSTCALYLFVCC